MRPRSKSLASLAAVAILFTGQGQAVAAEKDDPTTLQEFQE
ncbi:hypothetical protein [Corynebacterium ulcerans]|nr:hypothetical protein [Corynebacterium ulcerans]